MKTILLLLLGTCCYLPLIAQVDIIELKNPSFENPYIDTLKTEKLQLCCKGARGWYLGGLYDMNTPDAQPGHFGIKLPAIDGDYYLSMVTRDNETWESISQELSTPLVAGETYNFSVALAKSELLASQSRRTGQLVYYNGPIRLRIWAGNAYTEKLQLLAQSDAIENIEWETYEFILSPDNDYGYLTLEAFYITPAPIPYNGNLLLDNLSPMVRITD